MAARASTLRCSRQSGPRTRALSSPHVSLWIGRIIANKLRNGVNAKEYLLPDGEAPKVGSVIRQPALADTLRTIAARGPDGFYDGPVAEDIVDTLRNAGGLHTLDDFLDHRTEVVTPIKTSYRGYEIWQCPPNGPGVTMLMMLNVLKGFDLAAYAPLSVERLHLEAEVITPRVSRARTTRRGSQVRHSRY